MIKHISTIKEFDEEIAKELVLVDFYTDWCGPCKMLAPNLQKLSELHSELTILKINAEEAYELSIKYKIQSIPSLMLFSKSKLIRSSLGYKTLDDLEIFTKL